MIQFLHAIACFLFPFQNKCDQNGGTWWCKLFLAHLTNLFWGWLKKFRTSEIVNLVSPRRILEPTPVVFSVCQNLYQKLDDLLACSWQMHKLQIHKLVSWHDHLNVSTMYSIFDWKEFELLSYRQVFLESTEITAFEETNAFEKGTSSVYTIAEIKWQYSIF